jgi:hypothetical protein
MNKGGEDWGEDWDIAPEFVLKVFVISFDWIESD